MKILAKYLELPGTEISLFGASAYAIKEMIKNEAADSIVVKVQPHRKKKNSFNELHNLYTSNFHQVVLLKDCFTKIQVKIYSVPLSYKEVEDLKLTPIPEMIKKEKIRGSVETMLGTDKPTSKYKSFNRTF